MSLDFLEIYFVNHRIFLELMTVIYLHRIPLDIFVSKDLSDLTDKTYFDLLIRNRIYASTVSDV